MTYRWGNRSRKLKEHTPCGYCFSRWATVYDHLWPYVAGGLTIEENLYPSCKRCNSIAHDLCFDSIEEKREYIRQKLIAKGYWDEVPKLRKNIREEPSLADLLQSAVPLAKVGPKKPKKKRRCKNFGGWDDPANGIPIGVKLLIASQ